MAEIKNGTGLSLRMGVLIGILSIIVHYIAARCMHQQMVVAWGLLMGGLMALTTILYGITGITFANRAAGAVTFRQVFRSILIAILISTVISFVWSTIYMQYIDASYASDYQQSRMAVLKMMHKTPAELNAELVNMQTAGKHAVSIRDQIIFFGELTLAKSVVGAITTLLLLRTPKPVVR